MGIQQSVEEGNGLAYFSWPFGSDKHSTCSSQSYYYLMQMLIKFHYIIILYEVESSSTLSVHVLHSCFQYQINASQDCNSNHVPHNEDY
jgi:hypothetical protein